MNTYHNWVLRQHILTDLYILTLSIFPFKSVKWILITIQELMDWSGQFFLRFWRKKVPFPSFFSLFCSFLIFCDFFVVRAQICARSGTKWSGKQHICDVHTKKTAKDEKRTKKWKKMERAPFFVKNGKKTVPNNTTTRYVPRNDMKIELKLRMNF